jgi:hypothetical protein
MKFESKKELIEYNEKKPAIFVAPSQNSS